MAHKTLVNGTAHEITGGLTLVEGTSYSVKNGKVLVNGTGYDISFLLPPAVLDLWSSDSVDNIINCIAYANGYWVVGGQYKSGSTRYARIAYATSLSDTWTAKDLWSNNYSGNTIECIAYANGYWVVGGNYSSSSTEYARIAYATSLSGTWTTKDLWSNTSGSHYIHSITNANGYWVAGGIYYSQRNKAYIAYATSPNGTWTKKQVWDNGEIKSIVYANGSWVAAGMMGAPGVPYIAYATNLNDTWTGNSFANFSSINCIIYENGYWVVGGKYPSSDPYYARIAYATSLSGTWTTKDLWSSDYGDNTIHSITYANGYWVVGGKYCDGGARFARIAYATSLSGTWTTKDLWNSTSSYTTIQCTAYLNDYLLVGGRQYNNSTYYARVAYAANIDGFDDI